MKKRIFIVLTALCCMMSCTDSIWDAIHGLEDKYKDLDGRVAKLEELCKEMNTNISSLQTLVSVMLNNDYIVSVTPIKKEDKEVGYVITFAIHDPITIYYGKDGQDGQNGKDGADGKDGENGKDGQDGKDGKDGANGQDGTTPIIGVAFDSSDNAYYWTLNGDWLLDAQGNRIPLTSRDGKDGTDGKDGITPQLKIEEDYWYISTDNGQTWTKLGKAVGEDGKDGEKGEKGDKGDYFFDEIVMDSQYVYFVLRNGTVLKVFRAPKDEKVQIVDGAIMAPFSVSDSTMVYFSQGILLYDTLGTHRTADSQNAVGKWRFADSQLYSTVIEGISIFGLGNTGYLTNLWENRTYKASGSNNKVIWDYIQNLNIANLKKDIAATNYDWGVYNAIENGGNVPGRFRLLTKDEWNYLISGRWNAQQLHGTINVYDYKGNSTSYFYLLPDNYPYNYNIPTNLYATDSITEPLQASYPSINTLLNYGVVLFRIDEREYWTSTYFKTEVTPSSNYNRLEIYHYYYSSGSAKASEKSYWYYLTYNANNSNTIDMKRVRLVKDIK